MNRLVHSVTIPLQSGRLPFQCSENCDITASSGLDKVSRRLSATDFVIMRSSDEDDKLLATHSPNFHTNMRNLSQSALVP
ncbi:hypothetical protein TNCV_1010641 [Trichonephila clavipes]|nr:hypothetical protein TNCV_1010641 [Trichonephila clavipes]